ncbi:uncharacterized protein EDB91DRAFT_1064450 [Suillus paluster]|uniref:uncharacterized protein n=1 Tax=Suillus paluster TaxID=48578 RepID=UPI001B87BF1A|nr:uncharacterized protein EDB91DRAFT_1064450 [Suillus paluster]KAG1721302.1 hypothetical protein EDB91DRAFT_1064450 [Suillus paluster]
MSSDSKVDHGPCYFNRLPYDVAIHIFKLAALGTRSTKESLRPFSRSSMKMPGILASVDKRWRHIALSSPSLWSNLGCTLRHMNLEKEPSQLVTLIERSQQCPVTVFIDARAPAGIEARHYITRSDVSGFSIAYASMIPRIMELLLKEIKRWRSLTIFCQRWDRLVPHAFKLLSTPTPTGATCLEVLVLKEFHSFEPLDRLPRRSVPRAQLVAAGMSLDALFPQDIRARSSPLPRLRRLALDGVPINWPSFSHQMHTNVFRSLHVLELSQFYGRGCCPTGDEFSAILSSCPRLRKLVLMVFSLSGLPINHKAVLLPRLEELRLGYGSGYRDVELAIRVLKQIRAPNLISLSIEDCGTAHFSGPNPEPLIRYCESGAFPALKAINVIGVDSVDLDSAVL